MSAGTPATELTDAERDEMAAGWPDFWQVHAAVNRILAARAKPAPSGAEREALAETICRAAGCGSALGLVVADAVMDAGFRAVDSPAPSGAEAALAELLAEAIAAETAPCRLDHNGDCQEHGWTGGPCLIPRARAALAPSAEPDEAPIYRDKVTGEPCERRGNVLCHNADLAHRHVAIGQDELRAALRSAGPDTTCRHRYPDGTTCTLTDHSAPGVAEVHGVAGPDTTEGGA